MSFEISNKDNYCVININDPNMDAALAPSFKNFFLEHLENINNPVVIDLSNIRFMDSSGLGALIFCLKELNDKFPINLIGANEAVNDLFKLTSMHKLFTIQSSLEQLK